MPPTLKDLTPARSITRNALHNLVPFTYFKKREKHPRSSVTFNKVVGFSLQFC